MLIIICQKARCSLRVIMLVKMETLVESVRSKLGTRQVGRTQVLPVGDQETVKNGVLQLSEYPDSAVSSVTLAIF